MTQVPTDTVLPVANSASEDELIRHSSQPYRFVPGGRPAEKDWRRLPGFRSTGEKDWSDARWQRLNTVRRPDQLREVFGANIDDRLIAEIAADQSGLATMGIAVPPYDLNCMDEENLRDDPLRRYMLPAASDRDPDWPTHPLAGRDSLKETDMSPTPGLIHRYPTKALFELTSTCPQYCGHCTRMDLVGPSLAGLVKTKLDGRRDRRLSEAVRYVRATPWVRDIVISGGDLANVPMSTLEATVEAISAIPTVRSIRLATKGLVSLPQHFLQADVLRGFERIAALCADRDVRLAIHTQANHRAILTQRVADAVRELRNVGVRDIRNQGVILRGVNDSAQDLLDLCFALLDEIDVTPYYFYVCDLIPAAEHWRISLGHAQELSRSLQGYLPGFATPRLVCDVPGAGKRLVAEPEAYDPISGISWWTKGYRNPLETQDAPIARSAYFDPIHSLPPEGVRFWESCRT